MNKKKLVLFSAVSCLSLILVLALLLTACASTNTSTAASVKPTTSNTTVSSVKPTTLSTTASTTSTKAPKSGGTFRVITARAPQGNIGWFAEATFRGGLWSAPMSDGLLDCDNNGKISPRLATAWEVASDMKSIKLSLRKGVKFHDGSDFNSKVAKWNLEQLMAAKTSTTINYSSIDIIDDYAIKINLKQYQNTILNDLTMSMVSLAAFEKGGAAGLRLNPVTTGPFKFKSFETDYNIKYTRFDDYWGGKPYLDSIEMYFMPDLVTASSSFDAGEADAFDGDLGKIHYDLQQKGYPIVKGWSGTCQLISDSKNSDSPFANLKVRQALDYAIDKDALVKATGFGFKEPSSQFAYPGTAYAIKTTSTYNPEKSRQLLTEAGYPGGFNIDIHGDNAIVNRDEAVIIQNFLQKVGIIAKLDIVDTTASTKYKMGGWKNGLYMGILGIDANANATLNRDVPSTSVSYPSTLRPPELDGLIAVSSTSIDFNPELVKKVNQSMYDFAMQTFYATNSHGAVVKSYVRDTGFMTKQTWPGWTPEKTWLDK
jgi:peptide/nickel transport system substrate-binding protein